MIVVHVLQIIMEQMLGTIDFSFKYILLAFNFLTLLVVYLHKRNRKINKEHHLLFVTAHPDDEAMFFGPTITSLNNQYFIHLLCLSGKDTPRQQQLQKSVQYLGIHKMECVTHPKLQDGIKSKWCQQTISQIVKKYVEQNGIKAIFTFDQYGISGHINHQAIYRSISKYQTQDKSKEPQKQQSQIQSKEEQKEQDKPRQKQSLKIYYLQSTNLIRKYTGILEIFIALLKDFSWMRFNYFSAYQSMKFHQSQFTWYRKLWVLFSRYTYINTFQLRRVRFE